MDGLKSSGLYRKGSASSWEAADSLGQPNCLGRPNCPWTVELPGGAHSGRRTPQQQFDRLVARTCVGIGMATLTPIQVETRMRVELLARDLQRLDGVWGAAAAARVRACEWLYLTDTRTVGEPGNAIAFALLMDQELVVRSSSSFR